MTIRSINNELCTGCGICVEICPLDNLGLITEQKEKEPCGNGCPAGINMREYIHLIKRGQIKEAIQAINREHPYPAITGRVCFHPCESKCARNDVDGAVNINGLERFIGDLSLAQKPERFLRRHAAKVAVIGSGPAGLSAAYFIARQGYDTTVFEKESHPGGMLRIGIPEYRLPKNILEKQIRYFKKIGVKFQTNVSIGKEITLENLKNDYFKAVYLAVGAQDNKSIPGFDTTEGVIGGLDFIKQVNTGVKTDVSGKILVIGGGNVAIDAAKCAMRLGNNNVKLVCLESNSEMPAHDECLKEALEEGLEVVPRFGPKKLIVKNGKLAGVEFKACESVFDDMGRFNPEYDEDKVMSIECDRVILAIGQAPDLSMFSSDFKLNPNGTVWTNSSTMETSINGVFAGGEAVSGPSSVVDAMAAGKKVSRVIDLYLLGKLGEAKSRHTVEAFQNPDRSGMPHSERVETSLISLEQRCNNFDEIKLPFDDEEALRESLRCMTCGSKAIIAHTECMTCYACELRCPYQAIDVHPFRDYLPLSINTFESSTR